MGRDWFSWTADVTQLGSLPPDSHTPVYVIPAKAGIQDGRWRKSDQDKDGFQIKSGMTVMGRGWFSWTADVTQLGSLPPDSHTPAYVIPAKAGIQDGRWRKSDQDKDGFQIIRLRHATPGQESGMTVMGRGWFSWTADVTQLGSLPPDSHTPAYVIPGSAGIQDGRWRKSDQDKDGFQIIRLRAATPGQESGMTVMGRGWFSWTADVTQLGSLPPDSHTPAYVIPAKAGIQDGRWWKSDQDKDGFQIKSGMTVMGRDWFSWTADVTRLGPLPPDSHTPAYVIPGSAGIQDGKWRKSDQDKDGFQIIRLRHATPGQESGMTVM